MDNTIIDEKISDQPESSLRKGIWFSCRDGQNLITVWGSNFNGKEKIYLNNELISEKRSVKRQNVHEFTDKGGAKYIVEIKMESLRKGNLKCVFKKDGSHLKTMIAKYVVDKKVYFIRAAIRMILLFVILVTVGVVIKLCRLPDWIYLIVASIAVVILLVTSKKGQYEFEEEVGDVI